MREVPPMRRLSPSFLGGLLTGLIVAVIGSVVLAYTKAGTAPAPQPSAAASRTASAADRVDTDELIARQRAISSPASPPPVSLPSGVPDHGPLLFDVSSMLNGGGMPTSLGDRNLDKVQVVGQSLQFEVSRASRAAVRLPADVQPSSFVAVAKFDIVSGAGAVTLMFHMDQQGEQQHAVQVYTTGTTEAALFDGSAGTRSLIRRQNAVPALNGSATLAVMVNGPSIRIWVNGVEAGTATDGTLSQGSMGFKAGAAAREDPFIMRLTDLKVYQLPPTG